MCVLCGQLIQDVHWAERQLDPTARGGDGAETTRRQERFRRAKLLQKVLEHYGLSFHDDWSATSYVISDRKGRTELAANLAELWPAAERLAGQRLDPLDEALIHHLR
jgi:hypothetical protein